MGLPDKAVTLAPDQIADLNRRLSMMRHNINNQLALVVAAAELIRRKPEMAPRLIENILQQPERVTQEMRDFTEEFEACFGIVREGTTVISRAPSP